MARGADRQTDLGSGSASASYPWLSPCASCFTSLGASVLSSVKWNGTERGADLLGLL